MPPEESPPSKSDFLTFLKTLPLSGPPGPLLEKLDQYRLEIIETNLKINLISINDIPKLWGRHIQDALTPLQLFPELFSTGTPARWIDVGSGSGIIGMSLGIVYPTNQVTLLESVGKKQNFLCETVTKLSIHNITPILERSETLARLPQHRLQYNSAFARALAKPATALELVLPFIQSGGHAFFWSSGPDWEDTARLSNIAKLLGCQLLAQKPYLNSSDFIARHITLFQRVAPLDSQYPRIVGVPDKNPLK